MSAPFSVSHVQSAQACTLPFALLTGPNCAIFVITTACVCKECGWTPIHHAKDVVVAATTTTMTPGGGRTDPDTADDRRTVASQYVLQY
jgi:hypothetical protein